MMRIARTALDAYVMLYVAIQHVRMFSLPIHCLFLSKISIRFEKWQEGNEGRKQMELQSMTVLQNTRLIGKQNILESDARTGEKKIKDSFL